MNMLAVLRLRAPDARSRFLRHRGRLALFRPADQVDTYWHDYWTGDKNTHLHGSTATNLGEYELPFRRHLNPSRLTLEAGCGPAQYVRALAARGYKVSGVDNDEGVLAWIREHAPNLDVRHGDVRKLGLDDGALGGYVSLGVVEHFESGPHDVLREARRVLRADGCALISVPYLNHARSRHLQLLSGEATASPEGMRFYQYYFDEQDFAQCAMVCGLRVIDSYPLFAAAHLTRDHAIIGRYWNSSLHPTRVRRMERRLLGLLADAPRPLKHRWAHMMLFACAPA